MKSLLFIFAISLSVICRSQTVPVIADKSDLDAYIGKIITIKGIVSNTKIPSIIGVDISSDDPDLRGKAAKATGILIKWTVKAEDVDKYSQNRGSGTFYRLKELSSDYDAQVVEQSKIVISINPFDSTVSVENNALDFTDLNDIEKHFGEPDRIKRNEFQSTLTEYPSDKNENPRSYPVKHINYYYIYDKLGLMFYSDNSYSFLYETGEEQYKKPVAMLVNFGNKRLFDHDKPLPFMPDQAFSGVIKINGVIINSSRKAFSENVSYKSDEFKMYDVLFYPTSYTTIIDGLYSKNSWPYIIIKLDCPQLQRPSHIIIR
jgi:hypothetical protein